jgi:threonine dehydratase
MPEQANPVKVESMRALGAEVVFWGRDFDEAREYCEQQAVQHQYRYVHSVPEQAQGTAAVSGIPSAHVGHPPAGQAWLGIVPAA